MCIYTVCQFFHLLYRSIEKRNQVSDNQSSFNFSIFNFYSMGTSRKQKELCHNDSYLIYPYNQNHFHKSKKHLKTPQILLFILRYHHSSLQYLRKKERMTISSKIANPFRPKSENPGQKRNRDRDSYPPRLTMAKTCLSNGAHPDTSSSDGTSLDDKCDRTH